LGYRIPLRLWFALAISLTICFLLTIVYVVLTLWIQYWVLLSSNLQMQRQVRPFSFFVVVDLVFTVSGCSFLLEL
jgi:hypothetical protein